MYLVEAVPLPTKPKKRGYRVITNDILAINYQIALALIENNHETLNDDDVAMIFFRQPACRFYESALFRKILFSR